MATKVVVDPVRLDVCATDTVTTHCSRTLYHTFCCSEHIDASYWHDATRLPPLCPRNLVYVHLTTTLDVTDGIPSVINDLSCIGYVFQLWDASASRCLCSQRHAVRSHMLTVKYLTQPLELCTSSGVPASVMMAPRCCTHALSSTP